MTAGAPSLSKPFSLALFSTSASCRSLGAPPAAAAVQSDLQVDHADRTAQRRGRALGTGPRKYVPMAERSYSTLRRPGPALPLGHGASRSPLSPSFLENGAFQQKAFVPHPFQGTARYHVIPPAPGRLPMVADSAGVFPVSEPAPRASRQDPELQSNGKVSQQKAFFSQRRQRRRSSRTPSATIKYIPLVPKCQQVKPRAPGPLQAVKRCP